MPNQFSPVTPHPAYEETHRVPIVVRGTEAKKQFKQEGAYERFSSGTSGCTPRGPLDTRSSDSNANSNAQASKRQDTTTPGSQATGVRDAQHRHINVLSIGKSLVNAQARTVVVYLVLYAVTVFSLVEAFSFSHPAAWQTSIFLILSVILTFVSSPVSIKMLLFLMIAPWHVLFFALRSHKHLKESFSPLVSIIIPAYHEELGIVPTIKTVLNSAYRNIEIIVINDGSTSDNSDGVIKAFLEKYRVSMYGAPSAIPITYYYQKNAGKATALNTGIGLSHGEIIVCIDADCVLDKDCIGAFVEVMRDDTVMACCGNIKVGNPGSVLGLIQLYEYAASFYARQADALLNTLYVISGAAGAYRRSIFDEVGMYGTELRGGGEDVDLSIRVQQAGYRIEYCPDAIVYTEVPDTLSGLAKQRKRWTFSRFMTFKRYRSMIFSHERKHNKILTWIVMPLIIFNDWLYIAKMLLKIGLYIAAVVTGSYQVLVMLILLSMIITAIPLFQDKSYRVYLLLTPLSWLLSFVSAGIEMYASANAIRNLLGNKQATWHPQQRKGVISSLKKGS